MMEMESQTALTPSCRAQISRASPSPDPASPENHSCTPPIHHVPRLGIVIPNRIFVGGIDFKTNENDLRRIFSQYGAVKEVKIVIDRSGMSKGYGFVTFETQQDAQKILHDADGIWFKDKKLNIGQAVRKQQAAGHTNCVQMTSPCPAMPLPMPCGSLYLTTSTGYPYTYHNGVAYFHNPDMNPPAHHWPSGSPMMPPHPYQPAHQQPAYQHYQCTPNHLQWNVLQTPMASSPVVYMQPSDFLYQPINGGSVQPPLLMLEGTMPEQFVEPMGQPAYQVYAQSPGGMASTVTQQDHGKDHMFPSPIHLKPKYHRYANHKDYNYLPDPTEPTDPTMLHTAEPLM